MLFWWTSVALIPFGEITVLGIAAIGALCLMDGMRVHGTTMTQGLTYRFNPSPLMFRITASWVLPLAWS